MIYTSFFTNAAQIPNTLRKLSIAVSKKITLDGRIDALAPSWGLVSEYKNGTISQVEYTVRYNAQLEKLNPAIVPDNSVLFCYEKPGDFCHRHLVAEWLKSHGIPCEEWKGEKQMTALEKLKVSVSGMIKCGITDVGGDPAFTDDWIKNYEEYGCKLAIIVSKGLPTKRGQQWMLDHVNTTLFHATITGWGGTSIEEGVKPWREQLDHVNGFVKEGFPQDRIVIRVDPILLTEEGLKRAQTVITAAIKEGYQHIKFSWCDKYPHTFHRFNVCGAEQPVNVKDFYGQQFRDEMLAFIKPYADQGIHFSTCAESETDSPYHEGCVGKWAFEKCGFSEADLVGNANQRGACSCAANKVELLNYGYINQCAHACVYCFCKQNAFDKKYGILYKKDPYSGYVQVDESSLGAAKSRWQAAHKKEEPVAFRGDRFYLSNMYPYKMRVNGLEFSCVEAAFQSFKTTDPEVRKQFVGLDGKAAKALGRKIKLREDWEHVKVKVMRQLIAGKFSQSLGLKLMAEQGDLVETNTWHDIFWGVCNGKGQNMLGKILMEVRAKLLEDNNIFNSKCDLLVDPVNCLGQSGKGLALTFKQQFPEQEQQFIQHCQGMHGGDILVVDNVVYFATKEDWRNRSQLTWIDRGLKNLRDYCDKNGHPSIAIPALGCGLGGLQHEKVKNIVNQYFANYAGMVKVLF